MHESRYPLLHREQLAGWGREPGQFLEEFVSPHDQSAILIDVEAHGCGKTFVLPRLDVLLDLMLQGDVLLGRQFRSQVRVDPATVEETSEIDLQVENVFTRGPQP